jgi:SnoaL-like domain
MALSVDDRVAITDLINQHGHLTDRGDFDGMSALFTEDVTYDVSDFGAGVLTGLAAAREAALALGNANPVAHHVTNTVLDERADGVVHALSKRTPSNGRLPGGGSHTESSAVAARRYTTELSREIERPIRRHPLLSMSAHPILRYRIVRSCLGCCHLARGIELWAR